MLARPSWLVVAFCLFLGRVWAEEKIAWQGDLEAAKAEAARSNKLVLVHFWAPWCQPCMKLEKAVFAKPEVADALARNFVPVKLNVDQHKALAAKLGVGPIPADVVLSPDGQVVQKTISPSAADKYVARLESMAQAGAPLLARRAPPTPLAPRGEGLNAQAPPNRVARQGDAWSGHPGQFGTPESGVAGSAFGDKSAETPWYERIRQDASKTEGSETRLASSQTPGGMEFGRDVAAPSNPPLGNPPLGNPTQPGASARQAQPEVAVQRRSAGTNQDQPAPPAVVGSAPSAPPAPALPPLGFDGFCVVSMLERQAWVPGDPRFGVIHRGRLYLFDSEQSKQKFWSAPDAYAPVLSGDDAVILLETGQRVPGNRDLGVFYIARDPTTGQPLYSRLYLFASEQTLRAFEANPASYVERLQQAKVPGTSFK